MDGRTHKVGVIGYGMSAKIFHIPFIKVTPQLELYSIVQRSPKSGNSAPDDYPALKHYQDAHVLLDDPQVDVVVITTPPDSHFELTKAALQSGKHVLTEKPFAPTSTQAQQLADISKQTGKLICVYQNRRWDSDFLLVKHLLDSDALGRVLEFDTHFDRFKAEAPQNWKGELNIASGGSALFDLGTHLLDQAYALFGMPKSVHGKLLSQRRGEADLDIPDAVVAQLAYPDSKLVNVRISSLSADVTPQRFWVRGTKGSFRKLGLDKQEDQLKAGKGPTEADFGVDDHGQEIMTLTTVEHGKVRQVSVPELKPETYLEFYRRFAAAVASGREADIPVKVSEARDVLRIIEAVFESAKTGQDVSLA